MSYLRKFSGLLFFISALAHADCNVSNAASWSSCLGGTPSGGTISLIADISCTGTSCCGPSQSALGQISGKSNITVLGNGHSISRIGLESVSCNALQISSSSNIKVSDLAFKEDANVLRCDINGSNCPTASTIRADQSSQVTLQKVSVFDAPHYAVTYNGVNGITIDQSAFDNAGVLGVLAGPAVGNVYQVSANINITNSVFTNTGANALVLHATNTSHVTSNVFLNNHREGKYRQCESENKKFMCNGGQILVYGVNDLNEKLNIFEVVDSLDTTIDHNIIGDGYCRNCEQDNPRDDLKSVWPIEVGKYTALTNQSAVVKNLTITDNIIYNHAGSAVMKNSGSIADTLVIANNTLSGLARIKTNSAGQTETVPGVVFYVPQAPNQPDRCTSAAMQVPGANLSRCTATSWGYSGQGNVLSLPPRLTHSGLADWKVYRLGGAYHHEARYRNEDPGYSLEWVFQLPLRPNPKLAGYGIVYRCFSGTYPDDDFITNLSQCENSGGKLDSVLGFSVNASDANATPVYRCRNGADHFVSYNAQCEGVNFEKLIGYSLPASYTP
ncbi:Right handed beta helix region [Andreprevotia lacus DSM 23236]|jgi:hypothetical protein|uniref:Right handed beta helix region n=1 Tax=Andreprevotia lacus DSM 23236 TaxID=1121001 RepID=A0A1W1XBW6_9NEIS|nr:right-handed parallel beta-helix repeat-containing protein [Andreprevotia lacus]SMC21274.1 Right handed beta helix region [Andreprevotia lacus DSM 23236]